MPTVLIVKAGEVEILYDADDGPGIALEAKSLAEDGLTEMEGVDGGLIENEVMFVLGAAGIEPTSLDDFELHHLLVILVGGELVDGGAEGSVVSVPVGGA